MSFGRWESRGLPILVDGALSQAPVVVATTGVPDRQSGVGPDAVGVVVTGPPHRPFSAKQAETRMWYGFSEEPPAGLEPATC